MENVTWYLAGGGFTGRLQPLGQLTGAVAGCGVQGVQRRYRQWPTDEKVKPEIHQPNWTRETSRKACGHEGGVTYTLAVSQTEHEATEDVYKRN